MKWEESTNWQPCFSQNTWCCYGTFPLSRMEGFSVKEKFKTIIRDTTLFKTLSIKMKFQSLPLTRRCSWQRCHNSRWQGKVHHLVSPVLSTWQCFCFKHKITTDNLNHNCSTHITSEYTCTVVPWYTVSENTPGLPHKGVLKILWVEGGKEVSKATVQGYEKSRR